MGPLHDPPLRLVFLAHVGQLMGLPKGARPAASLCRIGKYEVDKSGTWGARAKRPPLTQHEQSNLCEAVLYPSLRTIGTSSAIAS